MTDNFTSSDVPDQEGKTFLITGANTGIGFEVARVMAGRGARVLMGCRSRDRAEGARARICAAYPEADVTIIDLDLGNLASVRAAAAQVAGEPWLDGLINNAGVMMPPRLLTADGFESQFGVNHLGGFALTGLLLPALEATPGARIVCTASNAHRIGKINFEDVNAERRYSSLGRYAMSKLANLLHTYELDRRLRARGASTIAVAAHPGAADTELSRYLPQWIFTVFRPLLGPLFNTPAQGAWPTLLAATAPGVEGGQYFGPGRLLEWAGPARQVDSSARSHDAEQARQLWEMSVEMTGINPDL